MLHVGAVSMGCGQFGTKFSIGAFHGRGGVSHAMAHPKRVHPGAPSGTPMRETLEQGVARGAAAILPDLPFTSQFTEAQPKPLGRNGVGGASLDGANILWCELQDVFTVLGQPQGCQVTGQPIADREARCVGLIEGDVADLGPRILPFLGAQEEVKAMSTFRHHALRVMDVGVALLRERGQLRLGQGHRPKPCAESNCQGEGGASRSSQKASPRGGGDATQDQPKQGQWPEQGAGQRAGDCCEKGPKCAIEKEAGLGLLLRAPDPSEGGQHGKSDVGGPRRPISGGKHFALSHAPCAPCEGAGHGEGGALENPLGGEVRTRHDMPSQGQSQHGCLDGGKLKSPFHVV